MTHTQTRTRTHARTHLARHAHARTIAHKVLQTRLLDSGTILRLLLESMRSGTDDEEEIARLDHDSPRLEELRQNFNRMYVEGSETPGEGGATVQVLWPNEQT